MDTVEILEKEATRLQIVLGKVDSNWCSLKGKSNIPTVYCLVYSPTGVDELGLK
jgi:hypothetical protein